jgi:probable rRNA maturation factor
MKISFSFTDVPALKWKVRPWKKWLQNLVVEEGFDLISAEYIFCSDEYLLEVNRNYLQHDYYTDIITFDLSEESKQIEGTIYISLDRVRDHARHFNTEFETELARVMAHGLLHLCGYKDKSKSEASEMRKMEDHYLSIANFIHSASL